MKASFLKPFFLLFSMISLSFECGMVTHNEISQRALFSFINPTFTSTDYRSYITTNQNYFEAASAYPDWGYLCHSPAGELSHWPPFLEAYKEYFLENYSIQSADDSHLLAFLFGVMSHDESDVLWHWGRQNSFSDEQGFLHSMAHDSSDCLDEWNSGTSPTCHTIGDTGADFFLAYRGGLDYLDKVWRVPTYDLSQIYQRMGLNISEWEIGGCMAIMFIGAMAERLGSGLILEYFGKHAAFLAEEVDLWFMGGIDDMAINTQWKWTRMIQELEAKNSTLMKNQFKFRRDFPDYFKMKPEVLLKYGEILGVKSTNLGKKGIEIGISKNQSIKAYQKFIEEMKKDLNITQEENLRKKPNKKQNIVPDSSVFSNRKELLSSHSYSYFGKSFTTNSFTGSTKDPLITFIGAPGYSVPGKTQTGAIYLLNHSSSNDIDYEHPYWVAPDEYSRCGWAVESLDINHDQIEDLIVSCPAYGPGGISELTDYYPKSFNGKIFVFLGRKNIGISPVPDLSITSKDLNDTFLNLGFYLSKGDCDNDGFDDLLVGSPFSKGSGGDQRGKVQIIQGLNYTNTNETQELFIEQIASHEILGEKDYEWMGYSIICSKQKLFIGSPGARQNHSVQASGKISIYNLNSSNNNYSIEAEIISFDPQSKLGISMSVNNEHNILAVGASSFLSEAQYMHAGRVYLYNLSELQVNKQRNCQNFKAAISGSASYARLGNQITWYNNDLVVSAPQYGDILGLQTEKGAVFIYKNAVNLDKDIDYENYDDSLYGNTGGGRFGAKIDINDKLGKIFIASPWSWNGENRLSGGLHSFDLEQTFAY